MLAQPCFSEMNPTRLWRTLFRCVGEFVSNLCSSALRIHTSMLLLRMSDRIPRWSPHRQTLVAWRLWITDHISLLLMNEAFCIFRIWPQWVVHFSAFVCFFCANYLVDLNFLNRKPSCNWTAFCTHLLLCSFQDWLHRFSWKWWTSQTEAGAGPSIFPSRPTLSLGGSSATLVSTWFASVLLFIISFQ